MFVCMFRYFKAKVYTVLHRDENIAEHRCKDSKDFIVRFKNHIKSEHFLC